MKDNQIDGGLLLKSEEELKLKGRKGDNLETEEKNKFKTKNKVKLELKNENKINKIISIKSKNKILYFFPFYSFFSNYNFPLGFNFGKEKSILKKSYFEKVKNYFFEDKNKLRTDLNLKKEKLCIKIHNKNIKDNIITKENSSINNIKIILNIIIMISFIQIMLLNNELDFIKYKFSNITLKIKGTGNKNVLSTSSNFNERYNPNMIYINGQNQLPVKRRYNFNQTDNFIELIWNQPIKSCYFMFFECEDITEIDLSNFNTSEVTTMNSMFEGCLKLSFLNLSNINTSSVTDMAGMFTHCSSLISLDLSNFQTSKVTTMSVMFKDCLKLISLNLSNFDTLNVIYMGSMFKGCESLEYINLKNFIEKDSVSTKDIFNGVPENVVICLNENSDKILSQIKNKTCYTIDCSDNWKMKQKKIVNIAGICLDDSGSDILFKYEYNGQYYENCLDGNLTNDSPIKSCSCDNETCHSCPNISLNDSFCSECNSGFYPKEDDYYYSFIDRYFKCYKDPIGYFLDKNESLYKKCFDTCKTCEIKGNNETHNCLECDDNFPYEIQKNNYSSCYKNCNFYHYFDRDNNYHCTKNLSCPKEYPKLIEGKMKCEIDDDNKFGSSEIFYELISTNIFEKNIQVETKRGNDKIKKLIEDLINNENNETIKKTKEEEIKYYDNTLHNIEKEFTSENYDISKLNNNAFEIYKTKTIKITFTTSLYQKNNMNDNMTRIDLGECELSLRSFYNLTNNETLYMKIYEIIQSGMRIPKIEYDVYSQLYHSNLTKLNLSICQKDEIFISIPVAISESENLDILNSSSGYYNDICYTTVSESGTDIILKDRRNEYVNKAVCQDDCDFSDYNFTSKKAKCSCKVKESSFSLKDMIIDRNKLLENFKNIKNIANLNILVCYKKLFSKAGISNNLGCYIIIAIIIFNVMSIFIFYKKQYDELKNKIKGIIIAIQNLKLNKNEEEREKNDNESGIKLDDINNDINKIDNVEENKRTIKNIRKRRKKLKKRNKINKKEQMIHININNNNNNIINNNIMFNDDNLINDNIINNNDSNNKLNDKNNKDEKINKIITTNNMPEDNQKIDDKNIIEKAKNIMEYNDDEINDLSYELALQYDKRSFFQYYISLIITKHSFIFTFFYNKDYNSRIIKINLFIFGFAANYAVNALFFYDDTMHNIYIKKGSFDLEYQLPLIVYSTLISLVIDILSKLLALSSEDISEFKLDKTKEDINERAKRLGKKLSIKFVLYFIMSFIFLLFFWYYISMFCVIYRNTQKHLVKDTLISFAMSLIFPLGILLIPGFFRIPSLGDPKNKREYLYKLSKIIPSFL